MVGPNSSAVFWPHKNLLTTWLAQVVPWDLGTGDQGEMASLMCGVVLHSFLQNPVVTVAKQCPSTCTRSPSSSPLLCSHPKRRINYARMSQSSSSQQKIQEQPVIEQQRITIENNYGEKLAGVFHEVGSTEIIILCHGFRSSKETSIIVNLAGALTEAGISVFRFDFSGNGESEGSFEYGNYSKEADDLHAVVLYFSGVKRVIGGILGHSKGGDVVLLYASKYHDVPTVVNVSGRYNMEKGIEERLGEDFIQRIKEHGFIDVKGKEGNVQYCVTEESLMERLATDMHAACLSIEKNCRVLTVHGSADEIIPVEDAHEFAKIIPNHKLHIVEGADHCYTKHQAELSEVVVDFIKESLQLNRNTLH
ncbi:hypothetical protein BVC80_1721g13 [Macleaya cordata]|uniref:Serine aminopeptidase S33 domain-containing protein n=1 Tax=Macleaya cordata TaxID=56857 RepID=A0A200QCQ2_MACCD|nr:hypothetical protein BVC80_1721g13 [Macleaya cordata]